MKNHHQVINYREYEIRPFSWSGNDSQEFEYHLFKNSQMVGSSTQGFISFSNAIFDAKATIDATINADKIICNQQNQETKIEDNVNNPSHYGGKDNPYEAIKIIQHYKLDFCLGNTLKYIVRAGKKDKNKEIEDLKKAKWYLETKIKELEKADLL